MYEIYFLELKKMLEVRNHGKENSVKKYEENSVKKYKNSKIKN